MEKTAIIMAGGSGTRFWPLSRRKCPKQCISITGKKTLIQETVSRLLPLIPESHIFVVTNSYQIELIKEQLKEIPEENIIPEPCGRNTAACIGLGAVFIERLNPSSTVACLPADHVILNQNEFRKTLDKAFTIAQEDRIVTLGISPTYPETGYGYIKTKDSPCGFMGIDNVYEVESFVEKPDKEKAVSYLREGCFLWNSGIFIWNIKTIMECIRKHLPELFESLTKIKNAINKPKLHQTIEEVYPSIPSISIDYGVMEKSNNILVIKSNFGWSDVGTWKALSDVLEKDGDGNVKIGNTFTIDSKNCILYTKEGRLIAGLGLDNIVIIDAGDAILVCPKERAQDVRQITKKLEEMGLSEYL